MGKIKIPDGSTAVRSESTPAKGYFLIFTTPGGEVKMRIGSDILRAAKLAAVVGRILIQGKKYESK